jgi:hypothetical protein
MSAESVTLEGRAQAEALMVDICTIHVPATGDGVFDDATGTVDAPPPVQVYAGVCRVQSRDVQPGTPYAGETEYTTVTYVISVPVLSVTDVGVGALITVTFSALDPGLVGRSFTITGLVAKSFLTARRFVCEEVVLTWRPPLT